MIMTELKIENSLPSKKQGLGRKPSAEEYEIGTRLYHELKVGQCAFFALPLKSKQISNRLDRLNKQFGTEHEFAIRSCVELKEVEVFRNLNSEGDIVSGFAKEPVEGFKVYTSKIQK